MDWSSLRRYLADHIPARPCGRNVVELITMTAFRLFETIAHQIIVKMCLQLQAIKREGQVSVPLAHARHSSETHSVFMPETYAFCKCESESINKTFLRLKRTRTVTFC